MIFPMCHLFGNSPSSFEIADFVFSFETKSNNTILDFRYSF